MRGFHRPDLTLETGNHGRGPPVEAPLLMVGASLSQVLSRISTP